MWVHCVLCVAAEGEEKAKDDEAQEDKEADAGVRPDKPLPTFITICHRWRSCASYEFDVYLCYAYQSINISDLVVGLVLVVVVQEEVAGEEAPSGDEMQE